MAKKYKLYDLPTGIILKPDENKSIPPDPDNRHYKEYLEWLKIDGNVPEEAD